MSNVTEPTTVDGSGMTATEKAIAEIWRDLLGSSTVSTTDNFFQIGGTSLAAIKLIQRVENRFGQDILSPDTLFADPRLGSVARAIDEKLHE